MVFQYKDDFDRQNICDIPLGEGDNQRIGRRVKIVAIDVQGFIFAPLPNNSPPDDTYDQWTQASLCRTILIHDKQSNWDNIAKADLFTSIAGDYNATCMYNPSYRQRFRILAEEKIPLGSLSGLVNALSNVPGATMISRCGSPTVGQIDWHVECDIDITFGDPPPGKTIKTPSDSISIGTIGMKYSNQDEFIKWYKLGGTTRVWFIDM